MIDSHHHFWKYSPQEYPWMGLGMEGIRRDFLPEHLSQEIAAAGVEGVVSVQARQTLQETDWLLEMAEKHEFIRGVVGWVPLISPSVRGDLERLSGRSKLKAVRHVLQDEADDHYMQREDFNRGVALLKHFGLQYDILIFEKHLPQTIQFVDRHPEQLFVLDHVAKPKIKNGALEPWRGNMRELARRTNVYCKVSGMVTEADWKNWTVGELEPYFETALRTFGPKRLMVGTDWPVCTVACTYGKWVEILRGWMSKLGESEREAMERGTAVEAYGV